MLSSGKAGKLTASSRARHNPQIQALGVDKQVFSGVLLPHGVDIAVPVGRKGTRFDRGDVFRGAISS